MSSISILGPLVSGRAAAKGKLGQTPGSWLTLAKRKRIVRLMQHSPGFLAVVDKARTRVNEINLTQAEERLARNPDALMMDVREDREWTAGHAAGAVHLSKGILERDIESMVPDKGAEVIMYCGGGFRSVLTAEVAGRMGYTNVHSLIGGHKALVNASWKMVSGD
ncbi:MAG: rhodanese-like domain-containing protein [Verrucomicrobiota bacterium]|nr:rhodanese-like domain-containing protein [Verrucomicrobiota bacterium]